MLRIALVGLMKSGKGLVKDYLVEHYDFVADAFADPVKRASVAAINAALVSMGCEPTMTREILERDKTLLRGMPQFIGTELGRNYVGPDTIWIDKLIARLFPHTDTVVDDCRFLNEAAALRQHDFLIVRVSRPDRERFKAIEDDLYERHPDWNRFRAYEEASKLMQHGSEVEVPYIHADAELYNKDTVDNLLDQVDDLIHGLLSVEPPRPTLTLVPTN